MATKQLAMELGLVQKRQLNTNTKSATAGTKQEFEFLVVLDFESTCWEGGGDGGRCTAQQEIIEFPAVLLDLRTGQVVAHFQQYVMPLEQPILSSFCTSLTGITQEQVEDGVPLGTCLYLFSSWIQQLCDLHRMSFNTSLPGNHVTFATWSDWDLGVCLQRECARKRLKKPEYFNQWADVRMLYKRFYQRNPKGLVGALQDLGLSFTGREHSGICDARNTAALITRMARDGCLLTVTRSLAPQATKVSSLKASVGKLLSHVKASVFGRRKEDSLQDNPQKYNSRHHDILSKERSKKPSHDVGVRKSGPLDARSGFEAGVAPGPLREVAWDHNSKITAQVSGSTKCLKYNTNVTGIQKNSARNSNGYKENLKAQHGATWVSADKNTSDKDKPWQQSVSLHKSFKVPGFPQLKRKSEVSTENSSNLSNSNLKVPKLQTNCKTHPRESPAGMPTTTGSSAVRRASGPSSSVQTPMFPVQRVQHFKKTPPLCDCGRRAKLLVASNPGPNQGRQFFTCPQNRTGEVKVCTFFKWEADPSPAGPPSREAQTPALNLHSQFVAKSLPLQRHSHHDSHQAKTEPWRGRYKLFHANCDAPSRTPNSKDSNPRQSGTTPCQITPYITKSKMVNNGLY